MEKQNQLIPNNQTQLLLKEKHQLKELLILQEKYCAKLPNVSSFRQIFSSGELSLATIHREKGKEVVGSMIYLFVSEFLIKHLNVGKTMTDVQIAYLCDLILEDYYFLQIDDFKYCFSKAIKGEYGKIYDRIDANIILDWLRQYTNSRCAFGSTITIDEAKSLENEKVSSYDEYLKSISERANNGDESAIEALSRAKELAEFRARIQPVSNKYQKDREYKRLHGR